jgi:two-component sensor histidine kinase
MAGLVGRTILVVEDEPAILLDLTRALESQNARVVFGSQHADDGAISAAVLDGALPHVADSLTKRNLPFLFCSGRGADEFVRWPHSPLLPKPVSAQAVVDSLIALLQSDESADPIMEPSRPASLLPDDLVITEALRERPTKRDNGLAEVEAFHDLAEITMRSRSAAVRRFPEFAMRLCDAGSAGWSRLRNNEVGDAFFSWDALAGVLAPYVGGRTPRTFSPCGLCLDAGKTILVSRPERHFTYLEAFEASVAEILIVPMYDTSGVALGTLWVAHHDHKRFDAHDAWSIEQLSVQLVLALQLIDDAKAHDCEIARNVALARDADHRTRNALQSVASLLNLQARSCHVPKARAVLEDAGTRLSLYGTVHELLSKAADDNRAVDLGLIVERLVAALRAARFDDDKTISLIAVTDSVLLDPNTALSVSLLINEAIVNAYKHAYPTGGGEIFVRVARNADGGLRVGIQDDGVGIPPKSEHGFGMTLIRSFAAQVGGKLLIHSDSTGTSICLHVDQDANSLVRSLPLDDSNPHSGRSVRRGEHGAT